MPPYKWLPFLRQPVWPSKGKIIGLDIARPSQGTFINTKILEPE